MASDMGRHEEYNGKLPVVLEGVSELFVDAWFTVRLSVMAGCCLMKSTAMTTM